MNSKQFWLSTYIICSTIQRIFVEIIFCLELNYILTKYIEAFFEYYEDKLVDLYVRREKYLYDFNLRSIDVLFDMLQINLEYDFTKGYSEQYSDILDYRNNYKKLNSSFKIKEYTQVFESKHGYIENLSALDLIFNEGPNAINFLKTS